MKFARNIKIDDDEEKIEINLKFKTNNLYSKESKKRFDYFFDNLLEALQHRYHFENIKVK